MRMVYFELVEKCSTGPKKNQLAKKKLNWSEAHLEYLLAFMAHELVFFAVSPQMDIERVRMREHLRELTFSFSLSFPRQFSFNVPFHKCDKSLAPPLCGSSYGPSETPFSSAPFHRCHMESPLLLDGQAHVS